MSAASNPAEPVRCIAALIDIRNCLRFEPQGKVRFPAAVGPGCQPGPEFTQNPRSRICPRHRLAAGAYRADPRQDVGQGVSAEPRVRAGGSQREDGAGIAPQAYNAVWAVSILESLMRAGRKSAGLASRDSACAPLRNPDVGSRAFPGNR